MSCRCEQKKLASELDRIRKLAKASAQIGDETYAVYVNEDGTYGFSPATEDIKKPIVEYISKY